MILEVQIQNFAACAHRPRVKVFIFKKFQGPKIKIFLLKIQNNFYLPEQVN